MSQSTQNEQNNSGPVVLNPSGGTQVNAGNHQNIVFEGIIS